MENCCSRWVPQTQKFQLYVFQDIFSTFYPWRIVGEHRFPAKCYPITSTSTALLHCPFRFVCSDAACYKILVISRSAYHTMISTSCIWHTEVNVFLIRKAVSRAALFSYQHSFITLDIDFSAWNEELITHLSVFLPVCTMWLGLFKGGKGEAPYWRPVWADELWVRETGTFERPSNTVSHFFGRRGYQSAYQAKSVFAYFKTSAFYI